MYSFRRFLEKILVFVGLIEKRGSITLRMAVSIKRCSDGIGYLAWVPGWEDVYAPGETRKEALTNLAETAILVFRSYQRHGDPIPVGIVGVAYDEKSEKRPKPGEAIQVEHAVEVPLSA